MGKRVTLKRGDVYLVNFDPTVGSEIRQTRPALVLQNDIGNRYSAVTIVAAMTSFKGGQDLYPTEVYVEAAGTGLEADSIVLLNQLRTVDKSRLIKRLGTLDKATMLKVNVALKISVDLLE